MLLRLCGGEQEGGDLRLALDDEALVPTVWLVPFQQGHEVADERHWPFRPWLSCDVRLRCVDVVTGGDRVVWLSPDEVLSTSPLVECGEVWFRGWPVDMGQGLAANGIGHGATLQCGDAYVVHSVLAHELAGGIMAWLPWLPAVDGRCERGYGERCAVLHNALFHALHGNGELARV